VITLRRGQVLLKYSNSRIKLTTTLSFAFPLSLTAVNLLFIVRTDATLSQVGKDYLDAADRELARVSQVTSQTLRFHRQSTAATLVQPQTLLEEVLPIYETRLKHSGVTIKREYAPEVRVTCYEGDIRQVLNNLIGNAIDAMRSNGGRLAVRTRHARRGSTGEAGVLVTVADTGHGMSEETRRHIFDAFYTTKGIHGTGLGLWISCRIVHKHRGYVRAYSSEKAVGHGTVFHLWLPEKLASTAREAWHEDEVSAGAPDEMPEDAVA
ncbi:HAMP domain-containing histidine kinase, partial ['Planchonia careya' phytoplasma]|nr:HAMP domain-containing histidine kinase ['Planchonia careya' phytoplasma]